MKKGLAARWRSWRDVDAGVTSSTGSREAELDAMLRAGAAQQAKEGDGRLRWRVLGAVSAQRPDSSSTVSIVGRLGWRWGAVAACAIVAVGVGTVWLNPRAPQTASIGRGVQPKPIAESPTTPFRVKSTGLAFLQNPMTALAAQIDQPFEREAERLVTDAKKMVSFFTERVTAPISALHRAGSARERLEPVTENVHTGGA